MAAVKGRGKSGAIRLTLSAQARSWPGHGPSAWGDPVQVCRMAVRPCHLLGSVPHAAPGRLCSACDGLGVVLHQEWWCKCHVPSDHDGIGAVLLRRVSRRSSRCKEIYEHRSLVLT